MSSPHISAARVIADAAKVIHAPHVYDSSIEYAVTKTGNKCRPTSGKAVKFDAFGAVFRAGWADPERFESDRAVVLALAELDLAALREHQMTFSMAARSLPHETVIEIFREAWKSARATEIRKEQADDKGN